MHENHLLPVIKKRLLISNPTSQGCEVCSVDRCVDIKNALVLLHRSLSVRWRERLRAHDLLLDFTFSHLADAFIQSDLQIRKRN